MEERDNSTPQVYGTAETGMQGIQPAQNYNTADSAPVNDTPVQDSVQPDYGQQSAPSYGQSAYTQNTVGSAPVNDTPVQDIAQTAYGQQSAPAYGQSVYTQNTVSSAPVNDTPVQDSVQSAYGQQSAPAYGQSAYTQNTVNSAPVNNTPVQDSVQSAYSQQSAPVNEQPSQSTPDQGSNTSAQQTAQTNSAQNVRKPVYDKFMYEPIGFAGYDTRAHIPPENPYGTITEMYNNGDDEEPAISDEKTALRLIAGLIACCLVISVIGIVYDIANSKKVMTKFKSSGNIVLYSEEKPKGALDPENFKDETGKYTTEGVAELVRPSIVEIYTYSDPAHKDLVGTGSGVVISKDGYIVTNAHVLESDGYHTVQTLDEETLSATVIGRDVKTDIAVVKVNSTDLQPAILGNSDEAVVGEQVVAIGNPANLSSTVTDGIISAINRKIRSDSTGFQMDCIQTNADISPGNSGGALVNMYGQVIGITSSKYVSSSFEGLGFAITINEAKPIIEELINSGFIAGRFRIGITLLDMGTAAKRTSIEEAIGMELPENFKGVYISSIAEDADIAKTKLVKGDFITEIDGTPVSTYDELYDAISSKYTAGDTVPAKCAHLEKSGISYYEIKFKLMEDTSGNY